MTEAQQQPAVISVMLIVPDAEAAVAWYKGALGATELWNLGGPAWKSMVRRFPPPGEPEQPSRGQP